MNDAMNETGNLERGRAPLSRRPDRAMKENRAIKDGTQGGRSNGHGPWFRDPGQLQQREIG